ncbi:MAG: helix-turn-helix transcriptional regulator [Clostridia bacterium]|nr:helix-turn-helix transcriptional regulator [Clostridia bacterium]
MAVSYKKLWKLLIDKDMKKSDLERRSGITHYALGQLSQGKNVSTEVLCKICETLGCTVDDIMEIVPDKSEIG